MKIESITDSKKPETPVAAGVRRAIKNGSTLVVEHDMAFIRNLVIGAAFCCSTVLGADSTWAGYVTDTHCGTNCQRTSDMKPDINCIQRCVRQGSKYGLWSGNEVFVLEPQSQAAKFAAQNVEVTGAMRNHTIHITSISAKPEQESK